MSSIYLARLRPTFPRAFRPAAAILIYGLGVATIAAACDPAHSVWVALTPHPTVHADTVAQSALALLGRVAAHQGLRPFNPPQDDANGWAHCYEARAIVVCGKAGPQNILFMLRQGGAVRRFDAAAEGFRRAFEDSLRTRFGAQFVHECDLESELDREQSTFWRKVYRSSCVPRTQADSAQ